MSATTLKEDVSMKEPVSANAENKFEQGRRWGMHFKRQGIDYGRVYGHYPSCTVHRDEKTCEYCLGYEEGFRQ